MKPFTSWSIRAGIAGAGLIVALGASALPAAAQPLETTAAVRGSQTYAPAPAGLAYTYDAASQKVTITWAPKDPADTETIYYRPGFCGSGEPGDLCFVSSETVEGNSYSITVAPGHAPIGFRVWAVSSTHQLTASDLLVITV